MTAPALTGCPAGCPVAHECGVGEPIEHDWGLYRYQRPSWPDVHRADPWYLDRLRWLADAPTHAELEHRRWGGPRRTFGRPRSGDYVGAGTA